METETTLAGVAIKVIDSLATNPSMLLLGLVLVGLGWIAYKVLVRAIDSFEKHGEAVAVQLKSIAESSEKIQEDIKELSLRLEQLAGEQMHHSKRLDRIEDKLG